MSEQLYIVNVEAAIHKDDKWLIIKRSEKEKRAPGLLSLVGGKVETTASEKNALEATIAREIMEEVGVKIADTVHYVESKVFTFDSGQWVLDIVFLCEHEGGEARPVSVDEVSQVYWLSFLEVIEHKTIPIWTKESIERAEQLRCQLAREKGQLSQSRINYMLGRKKAHPKGQ